MKRKKWSEQEEQTLLSKYSELVSSGVLSKLKTREKKFKPIADHVTAAHHGTDPSSFPFRWSWRDVSVKVQNMRHQYLGVKQKIRLSDHRFDWPDGVNHWHNFLRYKHVFGDLDLPRGGDAATAAADSGSESGEASDAETEIDVARREERRREREERRERAEEEREERRERVGEEREGRRERREEEREGREFEAEERVWEGLRREGERRRRREREAAEERRRRMRAEERREEEEMEWRERMAETQMGHERRAMSAHAEACQTQMQAIGAVVRLACQLFGPAGDGLGALPPQVLQNLQHPGGGELEDSGKPESNSPSEFM